MNKDFAAWWLELLRTDPHNLPKNWSDAVMPIAEAAWDAAVACEEEKRKAAGGPG